MAIHPDHPGLTVAIEVADRALVEYNDDKIPADTNTINRYVEAQSGAEFIIRYIFVKPFPVRRDVGLEIYVDGNMVDDSWISKRSLRDREGFTTAGAEIEVGATWIKRRFRFNDLRIGKRLTKSRAMLLVALLY